MTAIMRAWIVLAWLLVAHVVRADDAILILDASKSMWGQVGGKKKVDIARAVVGDMLREIPAQRRLGFVAYGHRSATDCGDIEQLVPVEGGRGAIAQALKTLQFKGKTPLTAAVEFAAEKLDYTRGKATVILVSDGVESCHADPCAAAAALEQAGAELTVHVVGFGLKKGELDGLKCMADKTGGKYFAADDAEQLAQALGEAVAEKEPSAKATLQGPERVQVGARFAVAYEGPGGPKDYVAIGKPGSSGGLLACTSGCHFLVRGPSGDAALRAPQEPGTYELHYVLSPGSTIASRTLVVTAAEATITVPPQVEAGRDFTVLWTGPKAEQDQITLGPLDGMALSSGMGCVVDVRSKDEGVLIAPAHPGRYEVRYVLNAQKVLARATFEVTPATAAVHGPATARANARVEVRWEGPNNANDYVRLAKPGSGPGSFEAELAARGTQRSLPIPRTLGTYELRYVLHADLVIASQPIVITE